MTMKRWGVVVGVLMLVGMGKVAQQTAVWEQGYRLGRRRVVWHAMENDTIRLQTSVLSLRSPAHLATLMQHEPRQLVAWSVVPAASSPVRIAQASPGRTEQDTSLSD